MDFHDFLRFLGKFVVHHREVPKLCAGLLKSSIVQHMAGQIGVACSLQSLRLNYDEIYPALNLIEMEGNRHGLFRFGSDYVCTCLIVVLQSVAWCMVIMDCVEFDQIMYARA